MKGELIGTNENFGKLFSLFLFFILDRSYNRRKVGYWMVPSVC